MSRQMSQFNHMFDEPNHEQKCPFCNKVFTYSVDDRSLYGGHDSEPLFCPYCGKQVKTIYGGDTLSVYTNKIAD